MRPGVPEDWSAAKASKSRINGPRKPIPIPGLQPQAGRRTSKPVPRTSLDSTAPAADLRSPLRSPGGVPAAIPDNGSPPPVAPKQRRSTGKRKWLLWMALAILSSGGMVFMSVALLLKLPAIPNCPSIFWPTASASMRLYCAQLAANKQTPDDLLEAIDLVKALPADHPLRSEINHYLEQWALDLLRLGEEAFQAGKLQEAIAIARKLPQDIPVSSTVEKRINRWQSIWSEAEGIYRDAQAEMHLSHWHLAFADAVRLLGVGNNYWATTKYSELSNQLETARADGNKLDKAQSLAKTGNLANLLEAIKLVESIGTQSFIYKDAQDAIPDFGHKILDLAQETLDQGKADEAISIANQVPDTVSSLQPEVQDFVKLAEARKSAWTSTVAGLQAAIAQAQTIDSSQPMYDKAQALIGRWQLEIEDVGHLERARELASPGAVSDLTAAIAEAQLIPSGNPLASDAKQNISRWEGQVETIEDRPYLDHAEQLAGPEDISSLQSAINEASQIASGRALYGEAQRKIRTWTSKIEEIQDRPYLDGARELASSGDLNAAIATAQQIRPGRALSGEAQAAIDDWQGQIRARQNWQEARQTASQGTPEALAEAIRLAERVPTSSPLRADVNDALNQWSNQMLSIAQSRGESDVPGAIAIAKQIPSGTDAYRAAQEQIGLWQKFLNPQPSVSPTSN